MPIILKTVTGMITPSKKHTLMLMEFNMRSLKVRIQRLLRLLEMHYELIKKYINKKINIVPYNEILIN